MFEYSNFQMLEPSHGYGIKFQLTDEAYVFDVALNRPVFTRVRPYIRFEFSIPKMLYGHNLDSSFDVIGACRKVKSTFEEIFICSIPYVEAWYCYRIDTCANFIMNDSNEVKKFISHLQQLDYSRKPKQIHNGATDCSLYFATRYNTLKIYHKGMEYKKHDGKRRVNILLTEEARAKEQFKADCILRIEVEHRRSLEYLTDKAGYGSVVLDNLGTQPKLNIQFLAENVELFGKFLNGYNLVLLLEKVDFKTEMERVMKKLLNGTVGAVQKSADVYNVLVLRLGTKSGNYYYAIWSRIITHGQAAVKLSIKERTWFKACSIFRELGISLIASDIYRGDVAECGFPTDFKLEISRDNKYYQLPLELAA